MSIEQIRVGVDNFSYIIYCEQTNKAALVDPSFNAAVALEFISEKKLSLEYLINTHHHSDHISDNNRVKNVYDCELLASGAEGSHEISIADRLVDDGEVIMLGELELKFIHTPGHTHDGLCIIVDSEAIITGDTLFIGDCGRTDLLDGNLGQMYLTLQNKIKILPNSLVVYPGHDYGDKPYDTLGNQKKTNKTLLAKDLEEFSKIP
jgi:glyoxylase-like metal-dependent hydrolase (beta-lactamase superfamily II)